MHSYQYAVGTTMALKFALSNWQVFWVVIFCVGLISILFMLNPSPSSLYNCMLLYTTRLDLFKTDEEYKTNWMSKKKWRDAYGWPFRPVTQYRIQVMLPWSIHCPRLTAFISTHHTCTTNCLNKTLFWPYFWNTCPSSSAAAASPLLNVSNHFLVTLHKPLQYDLVQLAHSLIFHDNSYCLASLLKYL